MIYRYLIVGQLILLSLIWFGASLRQQEFTRHKILLTVLAAVSLLGAMLVFSHVPHCE